MNPQLAKFIQKDEEKIMKILRLFQLISGVNESIDASQAMNTPAMVKQLKLQKKGFVEELNEILRGSYKLLVKG